MQRQIAVSLLFIGLVISFTPGATPAAEVISTIDYPGAVSTIANGINAQGDLVGWYYDGHVTHGFLLDRTGFISIDYPQAIYTDAWAINQAGDIVGSYRDRQNKVHGYLLRNAKFTTFDVPGATFTAGYDIDAEGDIVGHYGVPPTGKMNGFLLRNGQINSYDFAPVNSTYMTCGVGINPEGQIVGMYADTEGTHGFVITRGILSSIDFPNAHTQAYGIDPQGRIVGFFQDKTTLRTHGFVVEMDGTVTQVDIPDSVNTAARRSNARGDLVGSYMDAALKVHGFLIRH